MQVRKITTHGGDIVDDVTGDCDDSDYTIQGRMWVRSDGVAIQG